MSSDSQAQASYRVRSASLFREQSTFSKDVMERLWSKRELTGDIKIQCDNEGQITADKSVLRGKNNACYI